MIKTKTNTKKTIEKTIASPMLSPNIKNPKKLQRAPTVIDSQDGDKLNTYEERANDSPEPKITVMKTTIKGGFLISVFMPSFVILRP